MKRSTPVAHTHRNKGTPHSHFNHFGKLTWSIEETNILKENYPNPRITIEELSEKLPQRTEEAIRQKASDLGLKRQWKVKQNHLSKNERCYNNNKEMDINYLLSYGERWSQDPVKKIKDLLSYFENIVTSKNRKKIYLYILEKKAATPQCIVEDLGIPEQSVYRELKHFARKGILEYAIKPRHIKKLTGSNPGIISLPNCDKTYIQEAIKRDRIRKHPKSQLVYRITQLILDEYFIDNKPKEIHYTSIVGTVRQQCKDYHDLSNEINNFSDEIAQVLHMRGIKVWR